VKRSGRDETMWVATHMCMEAMLGISMCSYLYPKLAKTVCFSYYLLCFLYNKIGEEGGMRSAWKQRGLGVVGWAGGGTHITKCKNDKRRKKMTIKKLNGRKRLPVIYLIKDIFFAKIQII
jgi:hypothetical protein